ncbi:bifunctional phosphopantothenoylcysteine decarboxylase/phosphopantothenate--cysteine ligase CoaBC [Pediococcus siamensis]|uniref:bifunctional phosphopantothenoylcysteine decarboxylase/phosphopantothenate--cysteine ligase CoaBC n=1 Tax=Pediococcus siamensis TaxID=381829 RepID=UPI00399F8C9E
MWKDKHVTFFITGGIAVYKVIELIRMFQREGAQTRVAMTAAATKFVDKATFQTISRHPVQTDLFQQVTDEPVAHIELADWTEIAIVAPATANVMAKMANGIADDFVSTTLLAIRQPIFVIPAMNTHMWQNEATKRNVKVLKADGIHVMEPETGMLAEGYSGKGRFPDNHAILAYVTQQVRPTELKFLKHKKILITAGGTKAYLDPVRYISNRSSGKMGYAFATVAAQNGADVTLISAASHLATPENVKVISVDTVAEMQQAVESNFEQTELLIMAAAVSDYEPVKFSTHKLKKDAKTANLTLELRETPDILKGLKARKKDQFVVGFAAETDDLLANAATKLQEKGADMIIANDVSKSDIGFDVNENAVTVLQKDGDNVTMPKASKVQIARQIFKVIEKHLK